MKKIVINLLNCMVGATILVGCGSGTTASKQPTTTNLTNPQGPVDYRIFIKSLLDKDGNQIDNKNLSASNLSGGNTFENAAEKGFSAAIGATGDAALSFGVSFAKNLIFGKPADPLDAIQEQLNQIENQLAVIQNTLNNDQNVFIAYVNAQNNQNTNIAIYNYNNYITNINSQYQQFILAVQTKQENQNVTLPLNMLSYSQATNVLSLLNTLSSKDMNTMEVMSNLTNSKCNTNIKADSTDWSKVTASWSYDYLLNSSPLEADENNPMAITMSTNPSFDVDGGSTELVQLLSDLYAQLTSELQTPGNQMGSNSNYINSIQQYNQTLMYIYLNAVASLQKAYTMEASLNYLNWKYPPTNDSESSQIDPAAVNECANAIYNPKNADILSYNNSQAYLTQLYANRINSLYTTIMAYMISDHPLPNGITPQQESYIDILNSTIPAKTLRGLAINSQGSSVGIVGGNWVDLLNLYQESGIVAYKQCAQSLYQNKQIDSTSCPSLMPNQSNGYYDGESIAAYNANNQLTDMFNFTTYCITNNSESPLSLTSWSNGASLQCSNWGITNYVIQLQSSDMRFQQSNSDSTIPSIGWLPTSSQTNLKSGSYVTIGSGHYPATIGPQNKDYHVYISTNSVVPESSFLLANGNGNFYQVSNPVALYNGGFSLSVNIPSYQTAGMQVRLPNGFNLPFYILSMLNGGSTKTQMQLVCPAANSTTGLNTYQTMLVPDLVSCQGSTLGDAGIQVQTSDGNVYNVTLTGNGSQQAYLGVSSN